MNKKTKTTISKESKETCQDKKCPIHGGLSTRGQVLIEKISSKPFHRTASISFERKIFDKKYKRYEKKRTKIKIHIPECIDAKLGDTVKVAECRPLSKTKNFVVIEKIEMKK